MKNFIVVGSFVAISAFFFLVVTGYWQLLGVGAIEWIPRMIYFVQDSSTIENIKESVNPSPTPFAPLPCKFFQAPSTPEIISCAFSSGKISEGKMILYLQYAVAGYNKLPGEFHSNKPWDGTGVLMQIEEAVNDAGKFCTFDIEIRRELMKYYPAASGCALR